jgi:lipopolysaccharide export system permease protein
MARDAQLKDTGDEGLSLDLANAFIHSSKEIIRNDYDYASSEFLRYLIPQDDLIQAVSSISPNQMSSTDLRKGIIAKTIDLEGKLDTQYRKMLSPALELEDSLRKGPANSEWNRRERSQETFVKELQTAAAMKADRSLFLYRLEFNKKYSVPSGALSFVFLAVSLGLMAKKSGQTFGFIFSLVISFIFWAMLFGGQTLAMRMGYSPFWTMWLPNILSIFVGFVLFVIRIRK